MFKGFSKKWDFYKAHPRYQANNSQFLNPQSICLVLDQGSKQFSKGSPHIKNIGCGGKCHQSTTDLEIVWGFQGLHVMISWRSPI